MSSRIVFASMCENAGKTSVIVGLGKALGKRIGYMKPMGDRLLYQKKRLWDYDSALVTSIFELKELPENITLGFEHSKLGYMYDKAQRFQKLTEIAENIEGDSDFLFIESGKDIKYGSSVDMDAIGIARELDASVVLLVSGTEDEIMDQLSFFTGSVDLEGIDILGAIINKVTDPEDFEATYSDAISQMGMNVIGILPYKEELTYFTMDFLANMLFAKILAGEQNLSNSVKEIFVGAMSASAAQRDPGFRKEGKLIITSGDRSDMILAAIDSDTAGIILTNNILPTPNIISKAEAKGIPLLLSHSDTFRVAKQIDDAEALLTKDNKASIAEFQSLVEDNIDLSRFG